MSEPILEPIWRYFRFWKAKKAISYCNTLFDYGSGEGKLFLKFAKEKYQNAEFFEPRLGKTEFPKDNSVDVVTMLAVIEHLENPLEVLRKLFKALKPGGKIVITTPSPLNWAVLEILSKLGLQSKREIDEHENYFFKKSIIRLLSKAGFKNISHEYFELYLNNFVCAEK